MNLCQPDRHGSLYVKKNGMTNRKIEYWVIPPESDAEFSANREDVLETYEKLYDPGIPVLCMDEQPVQLIKEVRTPIKPTPHDTLLPIIQNTAHISLSPKHY